MSHGYDLFEIALVPETVDRIAKEANSRDCSIEEVIGHILGNWAAKDRLFDEEPVLKCPQCGNDESFKAYGYMDVRQLIEPNDNPKDEAPYYVYDQEVVEDPANRLDEIICEQCHLIIYGLDKGHQA